MESSHLDLIWIEHPENIYYLTGCLVSRGMLFIFREEASLALDSRYFEQLKNIAPIRVVLDYKEEAYDLLMLTKIKKIGIEYINTNLKRFEVMKKVLPGNYSDTDIVKRVRAVKDKKEIALIQESCDLLWEGYEHISQLISEGITEDFLGRQFELYVLEKGAEKTAFDPTIAFGPNSAYPHYKAGKAFWRKGDVVLMDLGVQKNQYCSDLTRVHLYKETPTKIKEIAKIVREAYEAAAFVCKAGIPTRDVDKAARGVIEKAGYGEFFLHSLGHGVGLNVHEYPLLSSSAPKEDVIEEGMVFTIEPGIYLPEVGGIRYENTLALINGIAKSFFPHDKS